MGFRELPSGSFWRSALAGAAAGFVCGYTIVRVRDALREVRTPLPRRATRDATRYGARGRAYLLAGIARSTASLATLAFVSADPLERAFRPLPRPLRVPTFVALTMLIEALRELPIDYIEGYVRERVEGNTEQSARAWLADQFKGMLVGVAIAALFATLGDALVRRMPRRWPWIAIGATPPLLALANIIAPTYIMPLFNTFTPLEGALEHAIRALADRYDVGNAAILRFDMSRQTNKANAFVTGVFGTERIALADTLIENFAHDETMFVVAHELGHYVRRDPWSMIALGTALLSLPILAGDAALRRTTGHGIENAADGARFAFYAALVSMLTSPLAATASRALERRADRFALAATGDPESGVRAFRRLRERNLAEDETPGWYELLFATHPSLKSRIERLLAHT
jgi:STE24 endopeptidase